MDELKAEISAAFAEFELEFEREKTELKNEVNKMNTKFNDTVTKMKAKFRTIIDQIKGPNNDPKPSTPSSSSSGDTTTIDTTNTKDTNDNEDDDGMESDSSIILEEEIPVERNSFTYLLKQQQAMEMVESGVQITSTAPNSLLASSANPSVANFHNIQSKVEKYCDLFSRDRFLTCPVPSCMAELKNRIELELHFNSDHHDLKPYRCPIGGCGHSFAYHPQFVAHLKQVHSSLSLFPCNLCSIKFKTFWPLVLHLLVEHEFGAFECAFTGCKFTSAIRDNVRKHCVRSHTSTSVGTTSSGAGACANPSTSSSTQNGIQKTLHSCDFPKCDKTFDTPANLIQHQYVHFGEKPYRCLWKGCGVTYQLRGLCYEHVASKHFKLSAKARESPTKEVRKRINNCIEYVAGVNITQPIKFCKRKGVNLEQLREQLKSKDNDEVIELDDDGEDDDEDLTPAPKKARTDQTSKAKSNCKRSGMPIALPRSAFNVESRNMDTGIYKGYSRVMFMNCPFPECNLRLKSRKDYEQHLLAEHGCNPYRCPLNGCGESFTEHCDLESHFRANHSHLCDWVCDQCTCSFKHLVSLLKHLCFEHELGSFMCVAAGCSFTGTSRSVVHNHYAIKHRITKYLTACDYPKCGMESKGNSLIMHQYVHVPHIRPFQCKWKNCKASAVSRASIYSHIAVKHFRLSNKYGEHSTEQRKQVEQYLDFDPNQLITDPISFASLKFDGEIEDFLAKQSSISNIEEYLDPDLRGVTLDGDEGVVDNGGSNGNNEECNKEAEFEAAVVQEFLKNKKTLDSVKESSSKESSKDLSKESSKDSVKESSKESSSPEECTESMAVDPTTTSGTSSPPSPQPSSTAAPPPSAPKSTDRYRIVYLTCPVKKCAAKLRCRDEFVEHLDEEHKTKPYPCMQRKCKDGFVDSKSYRAHHRSVHPHLIEFNCNLCTDSCQSDRQLFVHVRNKHEYGLFECSEPECDFTSEYINPVLQHHRKTHPNSPAKDEEEADEEDDYDTCDYPGCGLKFASVAELIQHQYEHVYFKPYRCAREGCLYGSAHMEDVYGHLSEHFTVEQLASMKDKEQYVVTFPENILHEPMRFSDKNGD